MSVEITKFINLVKENECLYSRNDLRTAWNNNATKKAWSRISKEMSWSVKKCKAKWKTLRTGFVRQLTALNRSSSSKIQKYYLHDTMEFLLPYVKTVQHIDQSVNIVSSDLGEQHSEAMVAMGYTQESSASDVATNYTEGTSFSMNRKKKSKRRSKERVEIAKAVFGYIQEQNEKETQEDPRKMFLLSLLPDIKDLSDNGFRQFKINSMKLAENLLKEEFEHSAVENFFQSDSSEANNNLNI